MSPQLPSSVTPDDQTRQQLISVTVQYEQDIAGAASALLALLKSPVAERVAPVDEPTTERATATA